MSEIVVNMELENPEDRAFFERGYGKESDIRRSSVEAFVDTGAVMLVLPQNVVERLGVSVRRTVIISYADERKEERPVAGPLTLHLGNRFMSIDCVVGPPLSEPLVGQVVLESLDLIADCTNRTLTPRPESPDYYLAEAEIGPAVGVTVRILAELPGPADGGTGRLAHLLVRQRAGRPMRCPPSLTARS